MSEFAGDALICINRDSLDAISCWEIVRDRNAGKTAFGMREEAKIWLPVMQDEIDSGKPFAPGAFAAIRCSFMNQRALEFGQPTQDGEDQSARRGRRISPAISQGFKPRALGLDLAHDSEQRNTGPRDSFNPRTKYGATRLF